MEKLSFEEKLKMLEEVVKALENKDISLDEAVKKYQLGQTLAKECYEILKEHERVIVTEAIS
ncbi:MAG: exodeoxyribonuclease VII small subunit [Erysipelotrichales bacterium]|nr:exodeoxyribonuclease VII small subunit [Erysipelotrichales bacterium]